MQSGEWFLTHKSQCKWLDDFPNFSLECINTVAIGIVNRPSCFITITLNITFKPFSDMCFEDFISQAHCVPGGTVMGCIMCVSRNTEIVNSK